MTLLEINLTDVLSETDPDDRVVVWAPEFREGPAGQLVGPRRKSIPLVDGVGSDEVVPGPLMVQVQCKAMSDTSPREVAVPEEGPVTLTALMDGAGAFTYAPPVVGRVALDAQRAEDAAVRAETVADAFGSLEGVQAAVDGAASSAAAAAGSATAAGDAAARAETAAENAQVGIAPDSVLRTMLEPAIRLELDGLRTDVDGVSSSWSDITDKPAMFPPEGHDHPAVEISDSSVVGRSVLTAADAAAARGAIGAGTSSLGLGSTSGTAAPGNHTHSQYATTTQVEARTPEIRIVSSPDMATSPGVLYVVRED